MDGNCCCGCGADASTSENYCSASGDRVLVACYSDSDRLSDCMASQWPCKRCAPEPSSPIIVTLQSSDTSDAQMQQSLSVANNTEQSSNTHGRNKEAMGYAGDQNASSTSVEFLKGKLLVTLPKSYQFICANGEDEDNAKKSSSKFLPCEVYFEADFLIRDGEMEKKIELRTGMAIPGKGDLFCVTVNKKKNEGTSLLLHCIEKDQYAGLLKDVLKSIEEETFQKSDCLALQNIVFSLLNESTTYGSFFNDFTAICGPEEVLRVVLEINDAAHVPKSLFKFFLNYFVMMCYASSEPFLDNCARSYSSPIYTSRSADGCRDGVQPIGNSHSKGDRNKERNEIKDCERSEVDCRESENDSDSSVNQAGRGRRMKKNAKSKDSAYFDRELNEKARREELKKARSEKKKLEAERERRRLAEEETKKRNDPKKKVAPVGKNTSSYSRGAYKKDAKSKNSNPSDLDQRLHQAHPIQNNPTPPQGLTAPQVFVEQYAPVSKPTQEFDRTQVLLAEAASKQEIALLKAELKMHQERTGNEKESMEREALLRIKVAELTASTTFLREDRDDKKEKLDNSAQKERAHFLQTLEVFNAIKGTGTNAPPVATFATPIAPPATAVVTHVASHSASHTSDSVHPLASLSSLLQSYSSNVLEKKRSKKHSKRSTNKKHKRAFDRHKKSSDRHKMHKRKRSSSESSESDSTCSTESSDSSDSSDSDDSR